MENINILIVDDEIGIIDGLGKILSLKNYNYYGAKNIDEAYKILKKNEIDLILLDLKLGAEDGLDFLRKIKKEEPFIPVIIITGFGSINSAIESMKAGATNYITKPIDKELLFTLIEKELENSQTFKENYGLKNILKEKLSKNIVVSKSKSMEKVSYIIEKVKDSDATVLITGASGTGKEIVARTIHYSGIRKDKPFISINCAALNDNLLESELFGHEKGAFTGAVARKLGRFELASTGTLFLDEVGDMSLRMQAKLLRVLQEKTFERVGGVKSIKTNARIIAATNKNLKQLIKKGLFREDLYYRLSLIKIKLPDLKERKEDIPEFIKIFIEEANIKYNRNVKSLSEKVINQLVSYDWPGNIRQLKNVITNIVILSNKEIIDDIKFTFENEIWLRDGNTKEDDDIIEQKNQIPDFSKITEKELSSGLKELRNRYIEEFEKAILKKSLKKYNYNLSKVSKILKITRKTLYEKIERYNL